MQKELFKNRFEELRVELERIPYRQDSGGMPYSADGAWQKWATSAQHIIKAVFGGDSPHHHNFLIAYRGCFGQRYQVGALGAIFLSAKEDFDRGCVFDIERAISGEVIGDFVGLARVALSEGHKDVAAVLACSALEDALKRVATSLNLDIDDKSMAKVVEALKSKGVVGGAQKGLLDSMIVIRNAAMHADWKKIDESAVGSAIAFVEQFLSKHFNP